MRVVTPPTADKKVDKALAQARQRGLADALAQERLALAAITKVMLLEVDDPARLLARLDSMARAAVGNRRVPAGTRRALLDGARLVRRAVERERSESRTIQTTLDPPTPEPKTERVDELAAATDGPQQLGLVGNATIGGDVEQEHEERVATLATIHGAIVDLLREHGASTDTELHHRYALRIMHGASLPQQTKTAISQRRRELCAAGRLKGAPKTDRDTEPRFDLVERELLEATS